MRKPSALQQGLGGLALAAAAAGIGLWWPGPQAEPPQARPSIPAQPSSLTRLGAQPPAVSVAVAAAPAPMAQGSLAGSTADGDWGPVDARGTLLPSRALRQRLDHHLSRIGELPLAGLRAHIQAQAQAERGAAVAQQVAGVLDRYIQLQQHAWTTPVNLQQPATWHTALQERQAVRRSLLGAAWAQAFYAEEEAELAQWIAHRASGLPLPQLPEPRPALHPEAAQREAALQAQWRAWDARVAATRQTLHQLARAPELSAPQREQALEAALRQAFPDPHEQLRARALLGVE